MSRYEIGERRPPISDRSLASRDHLDKVALVLAFFAGAGGSWLIKHLGYGPFWAVGWTIGAMLLYVVAVASLGRLRIEPEAIGDNCYYLGFLLTLASLSITLYQITQSDEQTELMRSIISGFGIALVSTILGILLRVIFTQLRPDIVARDRETRIELQQAARELRLELSSSVAAMKAFSIEAIQVASEQGAKITDATNTAVEAQRARMQSDVEVYGNMLKRTLDEAGVQAVKAIGESVSRAGRGAQAEIRKSLEEMSDAIAGFARTQTEALATREANDARAAAMNNAALERVAAQAAEIEALAARMAQALAGISADLRQNAESIEAVGVVLRREQEAAAQAVRAAGEAATAAQIAASAARESAGEASEAAKAAAEPEPTGGFLGIGRWRGV